MKFGIEIEGMIYSGDIHDCIEFMREVKVITSTNEKDSGVVNSMLSLPLNESVQAKSEEGKDVKITRTK